MSLKQSASEVLAIIERGFYEVDGDRVSIQSSYQASLNGSRLYSPDELEILREDRPRGAAPRIQVVDGTTQQVAQSLSEAGPVVLLNFASARNPGGGFLNGAKAQEEDLCRCSALYPTLRQHQEYYDANRKQDSLLYTDYMIFSPDVPFFKVSGTGELLKQPFVASVLTAPAPNTRPYLLHSGDPVLLEECFERRWRNVFAVAQVRQIPAILLGAWGCGAFGGDPVVASRTAKKALDDFGPAFEKVVFAIPGKGKQSKHNLMVFAEQLCMGIDRSV